MNRISSRTVVLLAVVFLLPVYAWCAEPAKGAKPADAAEEHLVVKVYRVLDLVSPVPNYPYEGTYLPTADARLNRPTGGSGTIGTGGTAGGGMGGGMGGMGGGMGGGMFRVDDNPAQANNAVGGGSPPSVGSGIGGVLAQRGGVGQASEANPQPVTRITMHQLISAITEIIDPETWDENGGLGAISPIGGSLAIRQTPTVQAKVQELLSDLKREGGTLRPLTVRAKWLWLNRDQLTQLSGGSKAKKGASETIDKDALAALPADAHRYAGEITCFNGQTVHIISGQIETVIQGGIPVVGGGDIGYMAVLSRPHLGALLQITPSILSGEEGVLVDLQSSVTRTGKPEEPVVLNSKMSDQPVVQIDRVKIVSQEFATSLRMPLDKPVIVGGMTFPSGEADAQQGQIVLVIEVHSGLEP